MNDEKIAEARVKVLNKVGLHARPAVEFVKTAKKFKSKITVCKDGECGDAKTLLQVLALDVQCGDEILIRAEGEDAKEAINALVTLIENKFGEE
ncbi:MAG: HPr family phosphocarrier protein [Candidatus Njordarchaeales archaeon]